jgi:hypothetical protein
MKINLDFSGLLLVLTVILICLKGAGVIHWSWWWVFGPLLIPALGFLAIASLALMVAVITADK